MPTGDWQDVMVNEVRRREELRNAWEMVKHLQALVEQLRAELAAAREDTARLDWIFEVGWAEQRYGDTLLRNRAQIDAARRREEEKR